MNPGSAADYRAEYRARHIGPHYVGGLHFAFTTLGCLAIIAGFVARLHHVTRDCRASRACGVITPRTTIRR
jgi:hypothetical protein